MPKIQEIQLTEEHIGRKVKYIPLHADGSEGHPDVEFGVITSFNEKTIFVRYGSDMHSKGTYPEDLVWDV